MRGRLTGSILTILAALAFSPALSAQTSKQRAAAKSPPDLSGRRTRVIGALK